MQAEIKEAKEYQPLIGVRDLPCWPAKPLYAQLLDGERFERESWDFESFWDQRKVGAKTLRVVEDFDFVILGASIGALPFVCKDILARDPRWRAMVDHVKTTPTQVCQLWLRESIASLGWVGPSVSLSGFVQPFDTWADMPQLIPEELWLIKPQAIAYFCGVLPDPQLLPERADISYPARRKEEVRQNAIRFLQQDLVHLWPRVIGQSKEFRWELLLDPTNQQPAGNGAETNVSRFNSQFWAANVNPSDRDGAALPVV